MLGGRLSPALAAHLGAHRALVFPTDPHAPVDPYRATLYTAAELYAGLDDGGYESTPDFLAYQWMRDGALHHDAFVTLLRAIHDDSISDALDEFTTGRPVVGVMGGHALARGTSGYAAAARLGRSLASAGLVVATGGGPGAMEAANLGALARRRGVARRGPRPAGGRADVPPVGRRLGVAGPRGARGPARSRTTGAASASPPGSTATSRRTSSATASASTSPTRSGRTACWPVRRPGSSCWKGPPGPCRRSSRP